MLETIGELLPKADLISHVLKPEVLFGSLQGRETKQTFISKLPFATTSYQKYLTLMPLALEMMDMSDYDLIVSSEAGPAKWIIPNPDARHICYCHSPLRYVWDQRSIYFSQLPALLRPFAELVASPLRRSDCLSATRVDDFVANSNFVAQRIWKYYRRESEVIHPPINISDYTPQEPEDFYLVAGEFRYYKRFDLAIRACTELGRKLKVIGSKTDAAELKAMAGPNVEFLGRASAATFRDAMARCRALLFPGVEDFGIIPLEVMASGRPVIAQARGGALDSVKPGVSGLLYNGVEVEDVKQAILAFEADESGFTRQGCVDHARSFDRSVFLEKFSAVLARG